MNIFSLFGTCKTAYGVLYPTRSSYTEEWHKHTRVSTADGHCDAPGTGAHKEAEKAGLAQPAKREDLGESCYYF